MIITMQQFIVSLPADLLPVWFEKIKPRDSHQRKKYDDVDYVLKSIPNSYEIYKVKSS